MICTQPLLCLLGAADTRAGLPCLRHARGVSMAASTPAAEDRRPMAGAVPPQHTRVNLKALLEAHVVSFQSRNWVGPG